MLKVEDLLVSEENPRTFEAKDQNEAIQFILEDQGIKIIELAKSMSNGPMASSVMLVAEDTDDKDKYRVYDGNRRLTVLKLARDPSLFEDRFPAIIKEIRKRSKDLLWDEFNCAVFFDKNDAIHESKKIHSEANTGSGIQAWPPAMIARDSINDPDPKYLKALLVVNALRDESVFDEKTMRHYYTSLFPFSTLDRVVSTSSVFEILGLKEESRNLIYTADKDKSLEYMKEIVEAISDKTSTSSRSLNDSKGILKFVNDIVSPAPSRKNGPVGGGNGGTGSGQGSGTGTGGVGSGAGGGPKPGKFFESLNWYKLDPSSDIHAPLLKICNELHYMSIRGGQEKIYEKVPIAASILLRSGYEQALKLLIIHKGLWDEFVRGHGEPKKRTLSAMEGFTGQHRVRMELSSEITSCMETLKREKYRKLLNDFTHNLDITSATSSNLEDIAETGMRWFIQNIIYIVGEE